MRKFVVLIVMLSLLFTGCATNNQSKPIDTSNKVEQKKEVPDHVKKQMRELMVEMDRFNSAIEQILYDADEIASSPGIGPREVELAKSIATNYELSKGIAIQLLYLHKQGEFNEAAYYYPDYIVAKITVIVKSLDNIDKLLKVMTNPDKSVIKKAVSDAMREIALVRIQLVNEKVRTSL